MTLSNVVTAIATAALAALAARGFGEWRTHLRVSKESECIMEAVDNVLSLKASVELAIASCKAKFDANKCRNPTSIPIQILEMDVKSLFESNDAIMDRLNRVECSLIRMDAIELLDEEFNNLHMSLTKSACSCFKTINEVAIQCAGDKPFVLPQFQDDEFIQAAVRATEKLKRMLASRLKPQRDIWM